MVADRFIQPFRRKWLSWKSLGVGLMALFIIGLTILAAIRFSYQGKLLPGAEAYGVYLGGMNYAQAEQYLTNTTALYAANKEVVINSKGLTSLSLAGKEIDLSYPIADSVSDLRQIGRSGPPWQQAWDQLQMMLGNYSLPQRQVTFSSSKLYDLILPAFASLSTPSENAKLQLAENDQPVISPGVIGNRLSVSQFTDDLSSVWMRLDKAAVTLRSQPQSPAVTTDQLSPYLGVARQLVNSPLQLSYQDRRWTIPNNEVLAWFSFKQVAGPYNTADLEGFYPRPHLLKPEDQLDTMRISQYLQTVAKDIERPAVDAKLTYSGNRATTFKQSQDGRKLDQIVTAQRINQALSQGSTAGPVELAVMVEKAEVNDDNIEKLGIRELLAEGVTYFPGSSANRLTNIKVGQALYNNYLLKPDQVFSFGEILGPVGPEQGYMPGLIILADHEEKAYGGGLCQVSSTAFRAALLAGLPIVERVNHAFAVSFYTAPFGVPGVDATIYYPQVDFKFKNDTGHYILIQTEMVGTTLKFRYYGTKTKAGVLRGPTFIYGSNDPNAPSQTVFYRDIVVDSKVTKTDTFKTSYKSALDYPVVD